MGTMSSLAQGAYIAHSSNYQKGRNGYKICKFTPHIMAGILTGKQCAVNIFQKPNIYASANYCIGNDGDIVCNVYEEDRAYTSSSKLNDNQAITVEVSNCEYGGDWKISDKAWGSLVKLAVDVCRRYNFKLVYDGTPNGSLTRHNMFANKSCPGKYLQGRFQELADIVNAQLDNTPTPTPTNYTFKDFVTDVQKSTGAKVDGVPGQNTLAHTITISKNINRNHQVVTALERYLKLLGYYNGAIEADNGKTPIFGTGMETAVKNFQKNNGLKIVDGIITAKANTWKKLLKLI